MSRVLGQTVTLNLSQGLPDGVRNANSFIRTNPYLTDLQINGDNTMFGKKKESGNMTEDQVFELIKKAYDSQSFKYEAVKERKLIRTAFMGDDLPIRLNVEVNDVTIRFISLLDFKSAPENFTKVAWELNCINKNLVFGAFYLDPDSGYVMFEYSFPYVEAKITEEFVLAFTQMVGKTVDTYDGDLKKIAEKVPRSGGSEPMFG